MAPKKNILEKLAEGPVIGDGGFASALERRGYVKAGPWTPEAVVEHPQAVISLHRDFLRAGADVIQAFTFYASGDKLINRGNMAGQKIGCEAINRAAAELAKSVASEGETQALTPGSISQCPSYLEGAGKEAVMAEFRKQIKVFVGEKLDFLICEYFEHIEEMEWAIEACKETNLPVAATMCIGPEGDMHGVPIGECGVRMARAGADIVGVNCHFDPFVSLEAMRGMKAGLDTAGLQPFLMCQPLGFHTPDAGRQGFIDLPEFPFALDSRTCTRWDIQRYAREAYELGIRYIGGCCGFEPYHIRALSEELQAERGGRLPEASEKHAPVAGLEMHTKPWVRARASKEYWQNLRPATGRPYCPSQSKPDNWSTEKNQPKC